MTDKPQISERNIPLLPDGAIKLLGFCRRSGKLVLGASQVLTAIAGKRPPSVVVIASDASDRTEKQLFDKCSFKGIKLYRVPHTGEELAHLLGKSGVVMAAGATDPGIAAQIIRLTENGEGSRS